MIINIIMFEQPIGKFALGNMNAREIIQIMTTNPQKYDPITFERNNGIQRELSQKRLNEIAEYAKTDDACFPTSIILSLKSNQNDNDDWSLLSNTELEINDGAKEIAMLVDGQHRMYGLERAGESIYEKFNIPVVFLFDATLEQQAKIFSIINSKQTQVSYSLVSQLFGIIGSRTPEKVAHDIASYFNQRDDSPFFRKIKMLGTKSKNIDTETLSQGTMVRQLVNIIDSKKCIVISDLYQDKDDKFLYKILSNYFSAAKDIWRLEWDNKDYIITKTVGFTGLVRAIPNIFNSIENTTKNYKKETFLKIFKNANDILKEKNLELTSKDFPSSGQGANTLRDILLEANKQIDNK